MIWPEKPTCHGESPRFASSPIHWREPQVDPGSVTEGRMARVSPYRSCSYCGSIHPEDLYNFLLNGARCGGSDWKYGWPHKFYVENIPNPLAGQQTVRSSRSTDKKDESGAWISEYVASAESQFAFGKWYNTHLEDITDEATFKALTELIAKSAGVLFEKDEKGLKYKAPYRGYQAS